MLCCGMVCSGKSAFARKLNGEKGFYHFSADDWMFHFYDPTEVSTVFDARLQKCKEMIYIVSDEILSRNGRVVLDFGFWSFAERVMTRARFEHAGHHVLVVYFPIDPLQQLKFMRERQSQTDLVHYVFDPGTIESLNLQFEKPTANEEVYTVEEFNKLDLD